MENAGLNVLRSLSDPEPSAKQMVHDFYKVVQVLIIDQVTPMCGRTASIECGSDGRTFLGAQIGQALDLFNFLLERASVTHDIGANQVDECAGSHCCNRAIPRRSRTKNFPENGSKRLLKAAVPCGAIFASTLIGAQRIFTDWELQTTARTVVLKCYFSTPKLNNRVPKRRESDDFFLRPDRGIFMEREFQ